MYIRQTVTVSVPKRVELVEGGFLMVVVDYQQPLTDVYDDNDDNSLNAILIKNCLEIC